MKSKIYKILFVFIVCLTSTFLTYKLCYFVAEKYFFDKLFYQKSTTHGYISENYLNLSFNVFGERAKYLHILDSNTNTLGVYHNNNEFVILIVGDSFTWGEGIRNNQRFSHLLESKLNKIRNTKIVTLSKPGWNTTEYLLAHQKAISQLNPNLIIFALCHNDIFLYEENTLNQTYLSCQYQYPDIRPQKPIDYTTMINNHISDEIIDKEMNQSNEQAWFNPINLCVFRSNLNNLPREKTLYFITDGYFYDNDKDTYLNELKTLKKNIINSNIITTSPKYIDKVFKDDAPKLTVSKSEGHPSAFANQMYADILFDEITTNPQWNFLIDEK